MNCPLLSIVTITKNDPGGLVATLASSTALRGDWRVEQLVIDGAGGTEVAAVAAGCRCIRQSGTGIAGAFNEGLAAARGDWVWFLNGGDRVHPGLDPRWLLTLLSATRADMVTGGIHYDGEPDFRPVPPLRLQWPPLHSWPAHPATLVRRNTLQAVGGFDPGWRIAMDFDLWMRLLPRVGSVDVISVPLAAFDVSGVSRHPGTRAQVHRETAWVLLRHCGWLMCLWLGMGRRLLFVMLRALAYLLFRSPGC